MKLKKFSFSVLPLFLCVITLLCVFALAGLSGTGVYAGNKKLPIYSVETDKKVVAISFDCAWGTDYTDNLLSIMEEKKVVSTFFAVEFWVNKNKEFVKKIVDSGHGFGTHSSTHSHMSKLSKEKIISELSSSKKAIENITGKSVTLFRAPYGDYNDTLIETATSMGLFTVQWDVDSLDWKNLSAKEIKERVLKKVKNGSIVLFHNNGLHTAESLPMIIDGLKESGYEFLKIEDLIYKENFYIDVNGRQKPQKSG